jgi:hypothetical protein
LGAGLTIQPCKNLLLRNPNRGGQSTNWAVEPYDDDDDDDDDPTIGILIHKQTKEHDI